MIEVCVSGLTIRGVVTIDSQTAISVARMYVSLARDRAVEGKGGEDRDLMNVEAKRRFRGERAKSKKCSSI